MSNQRKPFCKVCQDAGKPENIYTSHYTRESADPKSKVICPTLLALECRYCFKNGHTVKYCSVLASNKKMQEKAAQKQQEQKQQEQKQKEQAKAATKKKASNAFAAFDSDSEDETPTTQEIKEEDFPALPATKKIAQQASAAAVAASPAIAMSYATMASKPGFVKQVQEAPKTTTWAEEHEEDDNEEYEEALRKARLAVIMEKSYKPSIYGKASEIDWAAKDSDSDSDDDW